MTTDTKYTLLNAPCQSGKTFHMFKHMIQLFEQDTNVINLLFCDNSILQTQQLNSRLNNDSSFEEYKNEAGNLSLTLSSKSKINNVDTLPTYFRRGYRNVVMCSNQKRVAGIQSIIDLFPEKKFNILIDEIDRNINLFSSHLAKWNDSPSILNILLVTATPNRPLLKLGPMKIIKLEQSYLHDSYHKFQDSEFSFYESEETEDYVTKVLCDETEELDPRTVWFMPSNVTKLGHYAIKDICLEHDMNCITINSDGSYLFLAHPMKKIMFSIQAGEELSNTLARIYKKHNLHRKPLAITGMLCISRGITISSSEMMITHAILPPKTGNVDSIYQLSARVSGNFRHLPNWRKPKVYCTANLYKRVQEAENKAIKLAEKCFQSDQDIVSRADYSQADSKYDFHEAGPFTTPDLAYNFLNTKFKTVITSRSKPWIIDDGYYVSSACNRVLKNDLTKEHLLTMEKFKKIPRSYNLTTGANYKIYPVYQTLESDATDCKWFIRYRTE